MPMPALAPVERVAGSGGGLALDVGVVAEVVVGPGAAAVVVGVKGEEVVVRSEARKRMFKP